jgi:ureidoacrylate peracid hydrolase
VSPTDVLAERVAPSGAALLVVDVQNAYCHPEGDGARRGNLSGFDIAIQNICDLISAARDHGVPVIFVRNAHEPCTESPAWAAARPGKQKKRAAFRGAWGAEFYRVDPLPEEPIVDKHRYSGFHGTRLDSILRTLGRSSVIVCGVATNVCVESTARDALFHDYHVVFPSDASATGDGPETHEWAVHGIGRHFGLVPTTAEVLACWDASAAAPAPTYAAAAT